MTPFVTVDEFFNYTGLKVGSLVTIRDKDQNQITAIITGWDNSVGSIFFGAKEFSLVQLWYNYEYQKDNAWIPFGLKEPGSNRKPAKFRVGSDYKEDSGSRIIRIIGKFRSPTNGNVYVAIERPVLQAKDPEIFLVNTEDTGDEYICEHKNEQTFKYKALDLI